MPYAEGKQLIKDRIVRIKLKKNFHEQKPLSYVGKVTAFKDEWVVLDARCIMLCRSEKTGVQIDEKSSAMMIPISGIETIRILPDSFDVNDIRITTQGQQIRMVVDKAHDAFLGEMGEG
jgi:hypothetical protein